MNGYKGMKIVKVVAAIVYDEGKIFASQRGYGQFKGGWELPGGKIEAGETKEEALKRELLEELDMRVDVGDLFYTVEYDYPDFHLTMYCFKCKLQSREYVLKEHLSAKWLLPAELDKVDWLPADVELIKKIIEV